MGRREELVEAAITCLRDHGYARTTTRQIVAEAGAHVPDVNYYFGSKQRLLDTAIVECLRRWLAAVMSDADAVQADGTGVQLGAALQSYLVLLAGEEGSGLTAAFEALAQAPRDERLRARLVEEYERLRTQTAERVTRSVREMGLEIPDRDAADVAAVLVALFDGIAVQWLLAPEKVPDAGRILRALSTLALAAHESEH